MLKKVSIRMNKNSILVFVVLILGILIACLPLRNAKLPGAYYPDLGYHLIRIEGIKESILAGEFPAKVYSFALGGWGYAGTMFYQDYLLCLPAFFGVCGLDIITSYKLMIMVYTAVIACTTYFSVKYISKSQYASSLATLALLLSQYYLADIYNRSGVSEYLAFIFVPVLIAGVYDTLAEECKNPWLIGIGLFGLLLTHSITFALGVVLLLACFALNFRNFLKKPEQIIRLIKTAVMTMIATAFIYIPLMEQMFSGDFRFHHPWAKVQNMTQPISTWFRTTGYFNVIAYVGIGIPVLLCLLFRFGKRKLDNKWIDKFLIMGVSLVIITSKFFPWKIVGRTFLGFIQFPYRLYNFAIPILTIGVFMLCAELFEKKRILGKFVYIFLCWMIVYCGMMQIKETDYSAESAQIYEDYFDIAENTYYVGAAEWIPATIKADNIKEWNRELLTENGQILPYEEGYNMVCFHTVENVSAYKVPLLYYKGYAAMLTDEEGQEHELQIHTNEEFTGELWVDVPDGLHGQVVVWYEGTLLQKVSMIVSLITMLMILGGLVIKRFSLIK